MAPADACDTHVVPWWTYTPDGRALDVEFTDGTWIASCEGERAVAATAADAIARVLSCAATPIGSSPGLLDAWVRAKAARIEDEQRDA